MSLVRRIGGRGLVAVSRVLGLAGLLLSTACGDLPRSDSQAFVCLEDEQDLGAAHPRAATLEAALAEGGRRHRVPGAVLSIRDAQGVWSGAYGTADAEVGAAMRTCQPTRIASVTKWMVALTALAMVESGRLQLDDTVASVVPASRRRDVANVRQATLRDLLANESGIPNYIDAGFIAALFNDPWRSWTGRQAVARVSGEPPLFRAGQDFAYSNTGYLLAGEMLVAADGQPLEDIFARELFEPVGMMSTSYVPDREDYDGIARGYFDLLGTGELVDSTESYARSVIDADGGVVSTAPDLRRLLDAAFRDGTLLSAQSVARMTELRPTARDPAWSLEEYEGYGLGTMGWRTPKGALGYGHSGDDFGYQAFAYHFPDDELTFVLLVNGGAILDSGDNLSARVAALRDELVEVALAR